MSSTEEFKENLSELSADSADIAINLLIESELFEDVPFAGMLLKAGRAISSIPDIIFLHKLGIFIKTVDGKTKYEERVLFAKEIKNEKSKRDKLYNAIFLKLDKFYDLTKPNLFARIFSCFITNRIDEQEYLALSSALNLASLEALRDFSFLYWTGKGYLGDSVFKSTKSSRANYGNLLSTGFVSLSISEDYMKRSRQMRQNSVSDSTSELNFNITLLGHLYAYIADDFEEYFAWIEDAVGRFPGSNKRQYEFEYPSSNEAFNGKLQQKIQAWG